LHIGLAAAPGSLASTGEESGAGPVHSGTFTFAGGKIRAGASAGKVTISWLLGTLAARPPFA
jgi:hypothetical protein